jgi:hypothetical protein
MKDECPTLAHQARASVMIFRLGRQERQHARRIGAAPAAFGCDAETRHDLLRGSNARPIARGIGVVDQAEIHRL